MLANDQVSALIDGLRLQVMREGVWRYVSELVFVRCFVYVCINEYCLCKFVSLV